MPRRRDLFRLTEVESELSGMVPKNTAHVLLTDLQQGTLKTVVSFPQFRDGRTDVSVSFWQEVDLEEFAPRPRRRNGEAEFEIPAEEFVEAEREKLRATTIGVFRRTEAELDSDYAEHFRSKGSLKNAMKDEDWEKLLLLCFRWQRQLSDEGKTLLSPMVTVESIERYLVEVRNDYGLSNGRKLTPGRPPADHWQVIYGEAIRQLTTDPTLLKDGNVQAFARALNAWATSRFGKNAGVPTVTTIADRLREVRAGKSDA